MDVSLTAGQEKARYNRAKRTADLVISGGTRRREKSQKRQKQKRENQVRPLCVLALSAWSKR